MKKQPTALQKYIATGYLTELNIENKIGEMVVADQKKGFPDHHLDKWLNIVM